MTKEMILQKVCGLNVQFESYKNWENLVEMLKQDIRDENNKRNGNGKIAKLANAILKSAKQNYSYNDHKHNRLEYSKIIDGVQYVLDGHRIAGFYEKLDLPEWTETEDWFNAKDFVDKLEFSDEPVNLPDIVEFKAAITKAKAHKKKPVFVTESGTILNAHFIMDALQGFGNGAKMYESMERQTVNPVMIESDAGFCIILPICNRENLGPGFHEIY